MLLLGLLAFSLGLTSLILGAMLLAPLESLLWWAGWNKGEREERKVKLEVNVNAKEQEHYFVFLDGIAKASYKNYDEVEALIHNLRKIPETTVIDDIIPYAITGVPLTQRRPLAHFWRYALKKKQENQMHPIGFLINLRNLFQVLVSADRRYSTVYHAAEARLIIKRLLQQGYKPGSGKTIHLIGYSGGAQVATGVSSFLKESLRAPVDLISLGGVMSANKGLNDLRYIYHLAGEKDYVEKLAAVAFVGRWSWFLNSSWNKAKRKGKFTYIPIPACQHNGAGGYLDDNCTLTNGDTHLAFITQIMYDIVLTKDSVHKSRQKRGFYSYLYKPLNQNVAQSRPAVVHG